MLLLLSLVSASCGNRDLRVELEPTPVVSGGLGWGVVTLSYARLKAEPSFSAQDGGYARRGELLELLSRSLSFEDPDRGIWYRVKAGGEPAWLHQSALEVHASRSRAENAAGSEP